MVVPLKCKQTCAGYQSEQPCWQAFREENGYLQERCLGCDVFQQAPIPVNILNITEEMQLCFHVSNDC